MDIIKNKKQITEDILIEENNSNITETTNPIEKVRERNNFYTVTACVNKYLSYLYEKNIDVLYNYLDPIYIEQNNITKNNILQKTGQLDVYKMFTAKEMHKQKLSDNITKYYAYGIVKEVLEDGDAEEEEFYITIKVDNKNETFSVFPNTYIN